MIRLEQYAFLDEAVKTHLLCEYATFIASRSNQQHHVNLYRMNGFYIEVFLSSCEGNILKVEAFEDENLV